jgi:hypothetical protein
VQKVAERLRKFVNALTNIGSYAITKGGGNPDSNTLKLAMVGGAIWIACIIGGVILFVAAAVLHIGLVIVGLVVLWFLLGKANKSERLHGALNGLPSPIIDAVYTHIKTNPDLPIVQGRSHNEVLMQAFDDAKYCIVILSGWSSRSDLNPHLEQKIESALKRGVVIYIGYKKETSGAAKFWGHTQRDGASGSGDKKKRRGEDWRDNLTIEELPVRANLLIADDAYAVLGTHNWLSNADTFSLDRSWKITDSELVRNQLKAAVDLFRSAKPNASGSW